MQVHVAQHDADRTALWGSLLVWIDLAVFQDACLQPAPDQADHARIADAVLHEAEHPFVTERLTENELSDFSRLWHDGCVEAIIEAQDVDRNHSTQVSARGTALRKRSERC